MKAFSQRIRKLGVNPYVGLPDAVLAALFEGAGREKGPIPVRGRLNGKPFRQTLVRYQGAWRLYLNAKMREDAGVDVGDRADVLLQFDRRPPKVPTRPEFERALREDDAARTAFERLPPSRRKEIRRYLASLKTKESVDRNIARVILHLTGRKVERLHALMRR